LGKIGFLCKSDFYTPRAFFSKTHAIPFLLGSVPERVNALSQLGSPSHGTIVMKFSYQRNLFSLLGKFLSHSWQRHDGLLLIRDFLE
jgi:hypothetical protein